jgi:hypothetical protein
VSTVIVLSAYREPPGEWRQRLALADRYAGRKLYPCGADTHDEAVFAVQHCMGETELIIVTSPYHRRRAFLTFLAVPQDRGLDRQVRLRVAWLPAESCDPTPDEVEKITRYREFGHCASVADHKAYMDWWACAIS